jgi:hypothetical protein
MIRKLEYLVLSNLFGLTTYRTDRTGWTDRTDQTDQTDQNDQTDQKDSDQKVAISGTV